MNPIKTTESRTPCGTMVLSLVLSIAVQYLIFRSSRRRLNKKWVESEVYRIAVESRTLPAGCMDGHSPMLLGPKKIFHKISYKDFSFTPNS